MLFSIRFHTKVSCILICLLLQTQAFNDIYSKLNLTGKSGCPYIPTGRTDEYGLVKEIFPPYQPVPENFDAREKWHECESIKRIIDQGECGMCWAVAVATMLSDRICIDTKGRKQFEFSIEDILTCCPAECVGNSTKDRCKGALGNVQYFGLEYWVKEGVVSGRDMYSERSLIYDGNASLCSEECTNSKYKIPYKKDKMFGEDIAWMLSPWKIQLLQIEIMTNGPLITSFQTSVGFTKDYTSGVYQGTEEPLITREYHAVKIIGWGTENGVPYWLAANSWGDDWGDLGGFFKILRGTNLLGFEQTAVAGYFHEYNDYFSRYSFETTTTSDYYYSSANICSISFIMFFVVLILFFT